MNYSNKSSTYQRRTVLKVLGAAGLLAGSGNALWATTAVNTKAHIVIVGAGAAGLSIAAQLRRRLAGAKITLIDRRETHHFQPGYTLIGAGIWRAADVLSTNASYLPRDVSWIVSDVAEFEPDANRVITTTGQVINYDFLIVATGLHLDYTAIEGMTPISLASRELRAFMPAR